MRTLLTILNAIIRDRNQGDQLDKRTVALACGGTSGGTAKAHYRQQAPKLDAVAVSSRKDRKAVCINARNLFGASRVVILGSGLPLQMIEAWFSSPITVSVGVIGEVHNVSSARQALDLLDHDWPDIGSGPYRDARRACLDVVNETKKEVEVARAAFVEAARAARVLIE